MKGRIRELENGLGAVYSTISKEKHPLLSGEDTTSQGSSSVDVSMSTPPSLPTEADPSLDGDDVINCFGTLSVGTKGDSCFYGATARGEFLFQAPRRHSRRSYYFQHTRLNERLLSVPFPEASPEQIAPEIRQMVYDHLPPFEDARGTCELFLNYSSYMTSSLTREELLNVLETVYHGRCVLSVNDPARASPLLIFLQKCRPRAGHASPRPPLYCACPFKVALRRGELHCGLAGLFRAVSRSIDLRFASDNDYRYRRADDRAWLVSSRLDVGL
jgi:hypothetical protein